MPVESSAWRVERRSFDHPDAHLLSEQVQEVYVRRYGGRDESPIGPAYFEPPAGAFYVGYLDGEPVATGAWRRVDLPYRDVEVVVEVKRMYVVPTAQRRGLARAMLAHLERTALEAGAGAVVLETGIEQPEAIALYGSSGYEPVPRYGFYRESELSRCFGKPLDDSSNLGQNGQTRRNVG